MNKEELNIIDKYFRASNYLSVGQLYLLDNPLLKEELKVMIYGLKTIDLVNILTPQ